jgi:3-hydroxybutyryl-CoA dehydrogenase
VPLTVAIIGAGPLGRWLALSAARAGYRVLLEDVMPLNLRHAQEFLRRELDAELRGKGTLSRVAGPDAGSSTAAAVAASAQDDRAEPSNRGSFDSLRCATVAQDDNALLGSAQDDSTIDVAFVSTIEDAVRQADLVIDCVPDELESKLEILWLLDRMAPPRTVLATPTMRLSIADLANCTYRPGKVIAIAAEASSLSANAGSEILLRTAPQTSAETVALLCGFWERLGFTARFERGQAE